MPSCSALGVDLLGSQATTAWRSFATWNSLEPLKSSAIPHLEAALIGVPALLVLLSTIRNILRTKVVVSPRPNWYFDTPKNDATQTFKTDVSPNQRAPCSSCPSVISFKSSISCFVGFMLHGLLVAGIASGPEDLLTGYFPLLWTFSFHFCSMRLSLWSTVGPLFHSGIESGYRMTPEIPGTIPSISVPVQEVVHQQQLLSSPPIPNLPVVACHEPA